MMVLITLLGLFGGSLIWLGLKLRESQWLQVIEGKQPVKEEAKQQQKFGQEFSRICYFTGGFCLVMVLISLVNYQQEGVAIYSLVTFLTVPKSLVWLYGLIKISHFYS